MDNPNGFTPPAQMPPAARPIPEWEGGLEITICRHVDGWWRITGPIGSGLYISNPDLDLCIADIIPSWKILSEIAPDQVPQFPVGPAKPQEKPHD